MRKLTQREKVLVYIAVVLLLLTGVYYLVKIPSDMKRVRTEAELKIIQLQERESENDLTGKSVLEQEIGREQGVIGENTEDYLPYRTNSMLIPELAEYLTSFEIVPETIEVLDVSVLETKEAAETGYNIHKATVHVEASGTMEDLYRLLDWAYDRDWISVRPASRSYRPAYCSPRPPRVPPRRSTDENRPAPRRSRRESYRWYIRRSRRPAYRIP